jgi:hypothetical protein
MELIEPMELTNRFLWDASPVPLLQRDERGFVFHSGSVLEPLNPSSPFTSVTFATSVTIFRKKAFAILPPDLLNLP